MNLRIPSNIRVTGGIGLERNKMSGFLIIKDTPEKINPFTVLN